MNTITSRMQTSKRKLKCGVAGTALLALAMSLSTVEVQAKDLSKLAFFNTPLSKTSYFLKGNDLTPIGTVTLDLAEPADVLVQFTSHVAAETSEGCPCSVRAFITLDNEEPRPVKRINVASPSVQKVGGYEHDRQNLDGSTVFTVPAGRHNFTLSYLQMDGKSKELEVYYPNLQAISFPKK